MQRNVGNGTSRSTGVHNGHFTISRLWGVLQRLMLIALMGMALSANVQAQTQPERVAESAPSWSIIGPFSNVGGMGILRRTPAEDPRDTSSTVANMWGGATQWHPYRGIDMLGWVNLTDHAPDMPCLFVARTFVYVPTTRSVNIELGVSGAARFFLNDSLMAAFDDDVFARSGSVTVACTLWQGWNKIMVRAGRDVMPFLSFSLRLTDPSGAPMRDVSYSSTPQPVTKQQSPVTIIARTSNEIDTTFQRDPRVIRMLRQAVANDTLSIARLRQAAWSAYAASSLDTALLLVRTAVSTLPEDASMWLLKGLIYSAKNMMDSSAQCITRALEIDPGDIRIRKASFEVLRQRNPLDEVLQLDIDSIAMAALREQPMDSSAIETILLDMQQAVIYGSTSLQRINTVIRVNTVESISKMPLPQRFDDGVPGWQKLMIISGSGEQRTIDLQSGEASLDSITAGDVIVYSAERWHRDSLFPRYAHVDLGISPATPTRRARISIIVPLTDNYQFKIHNLSPEQTETETPSGMLFTWNAFNIPPIEPEIYMPPVEDFLPRIELSTFPGWATVVRYAQDAFKRRLEPCDAVRSVVDSLLPPQTTWSREVIVNTISHWVIKAISQQPVAGLAYSPLRACDVLALRSGTLADKVILASTMMAERGVEAIPTLVKMNSSFTYKEPSVSMPFDHIILVLPGDTSAQMIDLSFRPVPLGIAPTQIENAFALPASNRMRDPVRLHKRFMTQRTFTTSSEMSLDTSGWMRSHMKIRANDFDSSAITMMARSFVPTGSPMQGADMMVDTTWISAEKRGSFGPTCNIIMRNRMLADSTQDTITVPPRWMSMPSYPVQPLEGEQRTYPLVLPAAYDSVSSELIITAPKGYSFVKPLPKASFKLPSITYTVTSSVKGQTLRLRRSVVVHSSFIDPSEYRAFRDAHRQMLDQDRMPVRLQRTSRKRR